MERYYKIIKLTRNLEKQYAEADSTIATIELIQFTI